MVGYALQAADILAKEGISAEVINLRSIRPLDRAAINASVRKTNRLVTVEEGFPQHGIGAEIWSVSAPHPQIAWSSSRLMVEMCVVCSMAVVEDSFEYLDAPVERIAGADVPMPYAANLERMAVPQVEDIVRAAKRACYRAVPMAAAA
jgi:pyruvate dehydrogenase E1 component beta subunit